MIIFLVLLLFASTAWAGPVYDPIVPAVNVDGSWRRYADNKKNTVVDGGRTLYFSNASGAAGSDSNTCLSEAQACNSLSKMWSMRQSRDNILFRRGSDYKVTGGLKFHLSPSGTASDWTVYGSYGPTNLPIPKIDSNRESYNTEDKSYLWVDHIHLKNHDVIRIKHKTNNVTFSHIVLEDSIHTCINISNREKDGVNHGRGVGVPHHITVVHSKIDGCGVQHLPCHQEGNKVPGAEAFYLGSSFGSQDWGAHDIYFANNEVINTTKESINWKTDSKRVTIFANYVHNTEHCDDFGALSGDFKDTEDILVEGNIVEHYAKNAQFGNSVIIRAGPNQLFRNNLIVNNNVGAERNTNLICFGEESNANTRIEFNTFFNNTAGVFRTGNTCKSPVLSQIRNNLIKDVSGNGNLNPGASWFVNSGANDYRLAQDSPALDVHTDCRGNTKDIQGNVRPTNGKCDVGAFELGIRPVGIAVVSLSLGGSFPSTAVLDNFNRADENPLGGASTIVLASDNVMQLVSNKATASTNASSSAHWTPGTFNGPQEVYGTFSAQQPSTRLQLYACLQGGIATSGVDGYELRARRSPDNVNNIIEVQRVDNGVFTQIGGDIVNPAGLTYPAQLGLRIGTNGDLEVFRDGNSLGVVGTDTTYSCTGTRVGLAASNTANTIDDFGGGTYTETNPVLSGIETITATCTDDDGVAQICWLVNGTSVGCDSTAPFSIQWDTTAYNDGAYSMTATCRDTSSEIIQTQPVPFSINNPEPEEPPTDTTPPVTTITTPPPSSVEGIVTIGATCTDNAACKEVEFRLNGVTFDVDVAEAPTTSFVGRWNTAGLVPGIYLLTARGRDHAGNTHTSASLTVVVVAVYQTTEDATVCEIPATCGYSARETNIVRHTANNEFRTYLKFDISSLPTGSIVDAVLTLNASGLRDPGAVQVFASSSDDWSEETIRWSNAPALGSELDDASLPHKGDVSWKITDFADTALNGDKIISVVLRDKNTTGKGFHFDSKERGSLMPRLVITRGLLDPVAPHSATMNLPGKVGGTYVGVNVDWTGTCADDFGIHRAELHSDGVEVMSDTTAPYGGTWRTGFASNQNRTLKVVCFDYGGNQLSSATQAVTIDATPPTISNAFVLAINGTQLVAKWDTTDAHSGTTNTADINRCNPAPCNPCLHATANSNPYTMTFTAPNLDTISDWTIQAIDQVGNRSTASTKITRSITDLVAYWPFDGNCNDLSITDNDCTIVGNPTYVSRGSGQAIALDGNDYAWAANHVNYAIPTNLTVVAWAQCNSQCAVSDVILAQSDATNNRWLMRLDSVTLARFRWITYLSDMNRNAEFTSDWGTNAWRMVSGMHDGVNSSLYVDAVFRASAGHAGSMDQDDEPIYIGARGNVADHWTGRIDDVRIYKRLLTTKELEYLFGLF